MNRVEKRGVIIFLAEQGDAHRRVYLYTEEGLVHFTIYGAKSSKAQTRSSLTLFTMGKFIFSTGGKQVLRFVDVQVYNNGMSLTKNIHAYYAACAGAELTRKMVGAEHVFQFKLLVDFLLCLIEHTDISWRIPLIIFLWRSLKYNGWQPVVPDHNHRSREKYLCYHYNNGFSWLHEGDGSSRKDVIDYAILQALMDNQHSAFTILCRTLQDVPVEVLQRAVSVLFSIWQHALGYKLMLSKFVVQ